MCDLSAVLRYLLQLALKTVNTARSAFACFLFERKFFISYRDVKNGRGTDSQEEDGFKCKISARVSTNNNHFMS